MPEKSLMAEVQLPTVCKRWVRSELRDMRLLSHCIKYFLSSIKNFRSETAGTSSCPSVGWIACKDKDVSTFCISMATGVNSSLATVCGPGHVVGGGEVISSRSCLPQIHK